jgi:hypothetical protein
VTHPTSMHIWSNMARNMVQVEPIFDKRGSEPRFGCGRRSALVGTSGILPSANRICMSNKRMLSDIGGGDAPTRKGR